MAGGYNSPYTAPPRTKYSKRFGAKQAGFNVVGTHREYMSYATVIALSVGNTLLMTAERFSSTTQHHKRVALREHQNSVQYYYSSWHTIDPTSFRAVLAFVRAHPSTVWTEDAISEVLAIAGIQQEG